MAGYPQVRAGARTALGARFTAYYRGIYGVLPSHTLRS
jgi:hypothetical protein